MMSGSCELIIFINREDFSHVSGQQEQWLGFQKYPNS